MTEEELQLVLEPLYRAIVFGEVYDAPTVEEYVYTAIITFIMTGVVEAGDIANYARNRPVQHAASDFTWQGWWNRRDASITDEADAAVDPAENRGCDDLMLGEQAFSASGMRKAKHKKRACLPARP